MIEKNEGLDEYHDQYIYVEEQLFKLIDDAREKFPKTSIYGVFRIINSCVVKTIAASAPNHKALIHLLAATTKEGMELGNYTRIKIERENTEKD